MACTLQVHIQTDRLPDLENGQIQIGVRLSARFVQTTAFDPGIDIVQSAEILYPWKWDDVAKPENWAVFARETPAESFAPALPPKSTADDSAAPASPPKWTVVDNVTVASAPGGRSDLTGIIDEYIKSRKDKPTLDETASVQDNIIHKTIDDAATAPLFNIPLFLETLSSLPAPFPEALHVWTCLQFSPPHDAAGKALTEPTFVAYPRQTFEDVACRNIAPPGDGPNALQLIFAKTPPPPAAPAPAPEPTPAAPGGAVVPVAPAEPVADGGQSVQRPRVDRVIYLADASLTPIDATGDKEKGRLLDLSTLLVGGGDGRIETSDWLNGLVPGIARLLDPAAQTLAVLDREVASRVVPSGTPPTAPMLRTILADDLREGGRDILRRFLTYLSYPVMLPRPDATGFGRAPCFAALQRLNDPANANAAVQAFLKERWGTTPSPEAAAAAPPAPGQQNLLSLLSPFRPFGRDRLAGLVSTEPLPTSATEPRLDDDKAYVSLLVDYWLVEARNNSEPWVPRVREIFLDFATKLGAKLRQATSVAYAADALGKIFADDDGKDFAERMTGIIGNTTEASFAQTYNLAFRLAVQDLDLSSLQGKNAPAHGLADDMDLGHFRTKIASDKTPTVPADLRDTFIGICDLILALMGAAQKRATDDARKLMPGKGPDSVAGRLQREGLTSQEAPPCLFHFDQLQAFAQGKDLWERLSGLGVLVGREDGPGGGRAGGAGGSTPRSWWSLNVASVQKTWGDATPIDLAGAHDSLWRVHSRADPVPLVVSEIDGVRDVALRYNSQSIIASMESAPSAGTPLKIATPFRYVFPVVEAGAPDAADNWFPRLPPLTFGRSIFLLPYLIGHGGALPRFLRRDDANPTVRRDYRPAAVQGQPRDGALDFPSNSQLDLPNDQEYVRELAYLRTRPVGAPGIVKDQPLPGVPEGVAPLAAELPSSRPTVSIAPGGLSRWFLGSDGRGIMPPPASVTSDLALEIDLGEVNLPAGVTLGLRLLSTSPEGPATDVQITEVPIADATLSGAIAGHVRLFLKASPNAAAYLVPGSLAEDAPPGSPPVEVSGAAEFSQWDDVHLEIAANGPEGSSDTDFSPPAIRWGQWRDGKFIPLHDEAQRAPEDHGDLAPIHVLNGFAPGKARGAREMALALKWPTVDLATFDRWINGPISGFAGAQGEALAQLQASVRDAIGRAHRRAAVTIDHDAPLLDDPAVEQLAVELVEIFPGGASAQPSIMGLIGNPLMPLEALARAAPADSLAAGTKPLVLPIKVSDNPRTAWDDRNPGFDLAPGKVYDIRIYPVVADRQPFAPKLVSDRFAPCVRATWRRWNNRSLGSPATLRLEVATAQMPVIPPDRAVGQTPILQFEQLRSPDAATDRLLVSLNPAFASRNVEFYKAMRYMNRVELINQRWRWRGFPQPTDDPRPDGNMLADKGWSWVDDAARDRLLTFARTSSLGRPDQDVDSSVPTRLTRAHVYAGRATIDDPPPVPGTPAAGRSGPVLFDKHLDYRGGANLRRLGLRLHSRYAAMAFKSETLTINSHFDAMTPDIVQWQTLIIADQGYGPALPRPALSLIVPATIAIDAADRVAPVLALFNEGFFANCNIADDVEAVIDTVRYALADDRQKFWPEFGPDPIRTGARWTGAAVGLRVDGPIGYTFDADVALGRYDHSGVIVSSVGAVDPSSFVKIRFRRSQVVEFLELPDTPTWKKLSGSKAIIRLTNSPDLAVANSNDGIIRLPIRHEGVVFETRLAMGGEQRFRTGFVRDAKVVDTCLDAVLGFKLAPTATDAGICDLTIASSVVKNASTPAGEPAKPNGPCFSARVSAESTVTLRVVLSQRPKPNGGVRYIPAGDLVVRLFVSTPDGSRATPAEDRWISVLTLPLTPTAGFGQPLPVDAPNPGTPAADTDAPAAKTNMTVANTDEIYVGLACDSGQPLVVAPMRLSDFTPGTWCQFPALRDQIAKVLLPNQSTVPLLADACQSASCMLADRQLTLSFDAAKLGEATICFGTQAGTADAPPSVIERVLAVITTDIVDASAKLRERPAAVYLLPENRQIKNGSVSIEVGDKQVVWTATDSPSGPGKGHLRFVSVLLRHRSPTPAGDDPVMEDLKKLFSAQPIEDGDDYWSPPDAPGIIQGMSSAVPMSYP